MNEIYLNRVLLDVTVGLSDKQVKTAFQLFRELGYHGENYVAFQQAMKSLSESGRLRCLGTAASIGFKGHGVQGKSLLYSLADAPRKRQAYTGERVPAKYQRDWSKGVLGKVPHFIDARRDYVEQMALAMMIR
jgi:hypothetical protein